MLLPAHLERERRRKSEYGSLGGLCEYPSPERFGIVLFAQLKTNAEQEQGDAGVRGISRKETKRVRDAAVKRCDFMSCVIVVLGSNIPPRQQYVHMLILLTPTGWALLFGWLRAESGGGGGRATGAAPRELPLGPTSDPLATRCADSHLGEPSPRDPHEAVCGQLLEGVGAAMQARFWVVPRSKGPRPPVT